MATRTLTQIKASTLELADMTGSSFIDDTQHTVWINREASKLYDLLIRTHSDYVVTVDSSTVTLAAGTESYALPSDFYQLLGVFFKSGTDRYKLQRFEIDELDFGDNLPESVTAHNRSLRYSLVGSNIYFAPQPIASGTIELWYAPAMTELSAGGDSLFSVPSTSWIDLLELGVAARCVIKEERDPSPLLAMRAELKADITNTAADRDSNEPTRVTDVTGRFTGHYRGW